MRRSARHYLVVGAVVSAVVWRRPLRRVEVHGLSMAPALLPGDRLLLFRPGRVRPGDVVALADPRDPARAIVKRVAATGPDGITVLGDDAGASTDSRTFGPVRPTAIRGRAVYRYAPEHRRGRIGVASH
jgi:nickel-type superoxide dismutase maturation protease